MENQPASPPKLSVVQGRSKHSPRPRVECPAFLTPEARREWRRIAPAAEARGLLDDVSSAVFATYCEAWSSFVELQKLSAKYQATEQTADECLPPVSYFQEFFRASDLLLQLADQCGLTPASRAHIFGPRR